MSFTLAAVPSTDEMSITEEGPNTGVIVGTVVVILGVLLLIGIAIVVVIAIVLRYGIFVIFPFILKQAC